MGKKVFSFTIGFVLVLALMSFIGANMFNSKTYNGKSIEGYLETEEIRCIQTDSNGADLEQLTYSLISPLREKRLKDFQIFEDYIKVGEQVIRPKEIFSIKGSDFESAEYKLEEIFYASDLANALTKIEGMNESEIGSFSSAIVSLQRTNNRCYDNNGEDIEIRFFCNGEKLDYTETICKEGCTGTVCTENYIDNSTPWKRFVNWFKNIFD